VGRTAQSVIESLEALALEELIDGVPEHACGDRVAQRPPVHHFSGTSYAVTSSEAPCCTVFEELSCEYQQILVPRDRQRSFRQAYKGIASGH